MGNDGGSIPKRRELVKETARNPTTAQLKESQQEQQAYHWTTDPLSREPLAQPVVSDSAGRLYNKDTILELLVSGGSSVEKDDDANSLGAIKTLKDVVQVIFDVDADATAQAKRTVWKCPITGDTLGPGSKAVYLVPCGHAFSGSAIKEVSGEKCLTCEMEYASNDIIPILPTAAEDVARLTLRLKTLQEKGLTHSLKKESKVTKKRKKDELAEKNELSSDVLEVRKSAVETVTPRRSTPVHAGSEVDVPAGINNASTASLTAKVMQEQERAKRRKMESNNVRSLFSSRDQSKPIGKSSDFMSRGYSLPASTKR